MAILGEAGTKGHKILFSPSSATEIEKLFVWGSTSPTIHLPCHFTPQLSQAGGEKDQGFGGTTSCLVRILAPALNCLATGT